MSTQAPICVVAGVGNGSGTGAAAARAFAKKGYSVALIARNPEHLKSIADEMRANGSDLDRANFGAESEVRLNKHGKRGALIFTSATAAWRGNTTTSAFSAGKHGERALAQSLNKEFGPQNIHVSNVIIDGPILNGRLEKLTTDKSLLANEDLRLDPTSIAASYVYLAHQDRTAWTFELDLRPAHEKW
ncbi:hypothetical protein RhiTH_002445 [Rhizoctonia solani]